MSTTDIHQFNGEHILGEMYGIEPDLLNDLDLLIQALKAGIVESKATLCSLQHKVFEPNGVTILALLSESHTSIHTYPERGALFFDAFTCGQTCQPVKIAEVLENYLKPQKSCLKIVKRGDPVETKPLIKLQDPHAEALNA